VSELKLIHTQLGYRPGHGRKRILANDSPQAAGIFGDPVYLVVDQHKLSQYVLDSPVQHEAVFRSVFRREVCDFGPWLIGDIAALRGPTVYQAYCRGAVGPSFVVHDDVWVRILPECIRYMQIQSCGRNMPGWHDACHLDDGYLKEEDRYIEAVGAWHDAGDFRKHITSVGLNAYALLIAHRIWGGREDRLGLPAGIFLDEALQGVHYFLNVQNPETGMLHRSCGDGGNIDNRYTDNIRASGDERLVDALPALPAGKNTTLFALYANCLVTRDPGLAARCRQAAELSLRYDLARGTMTADALQWRAWAYVELWRLTQDEAHRQAGVAAMRALLELQVTDYVGGQCITRGFFRTGPDAPGYLHKGTGNAYVIWVIGEFIAAWPDHADVQRWKDALTLWADDYAGVFANRNAFGLLPWRLVEAPPEDRGQNHYRPLGDGLWYRYFGPGSSMGFNGAHALNAAALAAAAKALGRSDLLDPAYRLLEWIVGANPFQMSTVSGVGIQQANAHSLQVGNIPGGVMNGVGGDEQDMPCFGGHPWLCCAEYTEYYGYNTSQFLWAMAALQDLSW